MPIWTARRLLDWYQKLEASRELTILELRRGSLTRSAGNLHHVLELLEAILPEKLSNHVQIGLEPALSVHCGTTLVESGGLNDEQSATLIRSVSEPPPRE